MVNISRRSIFHNYILSIAINIIIKTNYNVGRRHCDLIQLFKEEIHSYIINSIKQKYTFPTLRTMCDFFDTVFDLIYPHRETNSLLMNEKSTEPSIIVPASRPTMGELMITELTTDGKTSDRKIIATGLLNKRLADIMGAREQRGFKDPQPTLIDSTDYDYDNDDRHRIKQYYARLARQREEENNRRTYEHFTTSAGHTYSERSGGWQHARCKNSCRGDPRCDCMTSETDRRPE